MAIISQESVNGDPYIWEAVTLDAPFAARDGAGLLSYKGKLWLLGGWNPDDKINFPKICNSEVWSSADGVDWKLETKQAPWEGRHTAGCVVHAEKMWIVGGDCNQGHYQPDVWNSSDGVNWTLLHDNVPWGQRVLHHTTVFSGKMWIMGGQTLPDFASSKDKTIFYNDVWCSEDGVNWERLSANAGWEPRGTIGGNATLHGRMWVIGGGTYDTWDVPPPRKFFNDVWSSEDGIRWERHMEHCPWDPREYHEIAVFDGLIWVMEGWNHQSGNRNDVWYSPDGTHWQELPGTPWKERHAASVVAHDNALWVIAGNNMASDVWKLVRSPVK